QDAWAGLEELDSRTKCIENRGDLHPCCPSADHEHRGRDRCQTPGIAMGICQLETRDREPPTHAASANDDLFSLKPQPPLAFDGVLCGEMRDAGVLVDVDSQRIELRAKGRMCAHIIDDIVHASKKPGIIEHRLAHTDAIKT